MQTKNSENVSNGETGFIVEIKKDEDDNELCGIRFDGKPDLLKTVSKGNLYTGQVMDIRKGTYLIKLSNGVNALAHSNYSRKNILKNDIVAFVVNRIDNKTVMVTGNIIRLIRSGRK